MEMKVTENHNMGGHLSTSEGLDKTPENAKKFGFKSFQIFSKNQMQWKAKPLDESVVKSFRDNRSLNGIDSVMIHSSYLLNTASSDEELRGKVREAFKIEIERADLLGVDLLTFHPGSFKEATLEVGIRNVASMLNDVLHSEQNVRVLIENSAGQGNSVGKSFQDISRILDMVDLKNKVGVCIDTCHVWAAGYNISTKDGYEMMKQEIRDSLGIEKIMGFHLNDSKKGIGEKTDRHEQIGKGTIGVDGFRNLMMDATFMKVPMIMETPMGEAGYMQDLENLNVIFEKGIA